MGKKGKGRVGGGGYHSLDVTASWNAVGGKYKYKNINIIATFYPLKVKPIT